MREEFGEVDLDMDEDDIIINQLREQYPPFIPSLIVYTESVLKDYVHNAKNKPLGFRIGMVANFGWKWVYKI